MTAWTEHVARWKDCQRCPLAQQRGRICLARGTVPCDVCFVGEAPGASEDAIGQPFVGPAGKLLDAIIASTLTGPQQQEVRYALTNLVCCFPAEAKARGENEPERGEILACRPRLIEFVNVAQPRLIVCVGSLATEYVDHRDTVRCCDIVHPAAILRMPLAKKQMATQHAIVILRNAVEEAMSSPKQFQEWGKSSDEFTRSRGLRQRYDAFVNGEDDVPF